jgi:hypothetical protein
MKSPMTQSITCGSCELEIIYGIPDFINGMPVQRTWKDSGAKTGNKDMKVISYGHFKLGLCPNAYVTLCISDGCKNLGVGTSFKCIKHNSGQEVYTFCRNYYCIKRPAFGYEDKKYLFCMNHKSPDMLNIKSIKCKSKNCEKQAAFGFEGQRPECCKDHMEPGMCNVNNKRCKSKECKIQPVFGFEGQRAECCKDHMEPGMCNVNRKKCEVSVCTNSALLGEDRTIKFCAEHRPERINKKINIGKYCKSDECEKYPIYGNKGGPAKFCKKHKKEDMINVKNKRCEINECEKYPVYGNRGGSAKFCKRHKTEDMINVKSKRCESDGCDKLASFGCKGGSIKFCKRHKTGDMINVKSKRCESDGCDKLASFGCKGGYAKFCKKHKDKTMIDVRHKRCEIDECDKLPSFGYRGKSAKRCKKHKLDDMTDVSTKKCDLKDCIRKATFGYKEQSSIFCEDHKRNDMIDLRYDRCSCQGCNVHAAYGKLYFNERISCVDHSSLNHYHKRNYNPICQVIDCNDIAYFIDPTDPNIYPARCRTHHHSTDIELILKECFTCNEYLYFPSDKKVCMNCGKYRTITKICHFKENAAKNFLISNNISFVHNRAIAPHNYRPDFLIESSFGYIILELDENQHIDYDQNDEIIRMKTIHDDIQFIKPNSQNLFIRFNPDKYDGTQYNLKDRYKYLYDILIYLLNQTTIGVQLGQLKLFYNGFNSTPNIENLI